MFKSFIAELELKCEDCLGNIHKGNIAFIDDTSLICEDCFDEYKYTLDEDLNQDYQEEMKDQEMLNIELKNI